MRCGYCDSCRHVVCIYVRLFVHAPFFPTVYNVRVKGTEEERKGREKGVWGTENMRTWTDAEGGQKRTIAQGETRGQMTEKQGESKRENLIA